jgi:hypothetical protein
MNRSSERCIDFRMQEFRYQHTGEDDHVAAPMECFGQQNRVLHDLRWRVWVEGMFMLLYCRYTNRSVVVGGLRTRREIS